MRALVILFFFSSIVFVLSSFYNDSNKNTYLELYTNQLDEFRNDLKDIQTGILSQEPSKKSLNSHLELFEKIYAARQQMKSIDIWLRYLSPLAYKKINAPLPIEWEVEVFEKFEAPYQRVGAGLTLAETYLLEDGNDKMELLQLINEALLFVDSYDSDSILSDIETYDHFFLANRLYLLNLAAIYTTGFECPNPDNIMPELRFMLKETYKIYTAFNQSFPNYPITPVYLELYQTTIDFVNRQPLTNEDFDHYTFIKDYINPLFGFNQQMIRSYKVRSNNFNDYSLNNNVSSIFDKKLYQGQASQGVYASVKDKVVLDEIKSIGKMLFFDPILSGNNKRSCASCHAPDQFFTDSSMITHLDFNEKDVLPRNTPSLLNVVHNHLLMNDGKHFNLQSQAKDVMTNANEMASKEDALIQKVMSCKDYKKAFQKFSKHTYNKEIVSLNHIASALSMFFSDLSFFEAPFDHAMNQTFDLQPEAIDGFNLFMSKGQCATCHFVPQFNGVKPPYIGSEFEVLGVPNDTTFSEISNDNGRHDAHPVDEMYKAFRTGSLRNSMHTQPYMHNGVFSTMEEVIEFYNNGGGIGHGLEVPNQTLPSDSLNLTLEEEKSLISFLSSLTEAIEKVEKPKFLPVSSHKALNERVIGGVY